VCAYTKKVHNAQEEGITIKNELNKHCIHPSDNGYYDLKLTNIIEYLETGKWPDDKISNNLNLIENILCSIDNKPKNKPIGCRVPALCFYNEQPIRHTIKKANSTLSFTYDAHNNKFIDELGVESGSLGGMVKHHYKRENTTKIHSSAWKVCKTYINNEWVSTDKISTIF